MRIYKKKKLTWKIEDDSSLGVIWLEDLPFINKVLIYIYNYL